jgi:hypothetical protein
MRTAILRLKRLREIRRDSRMRVFFQARQELLAREQQLAAIIEERNELERAILVRIGALTQGGGTISSGDMAMMERAVKTARTGLARLAIRVVRAKAARDVAAEALRTASRSLRLSEQSLEQIGQLDARLAEEELQLFEQQEEVESERIGRPRKPASVP